MTKSVRTIVACVAVFFATSAMAEFVPAYLFDVLRRPTYRHAWDTMMSGEVGLPRWVRTAAAAEGATATPGVVDTVDGKRRESFFACKAHDCADHTIVVLFSADSFGPAVGMLADTGNRRFFGRPSPAEIKTMIDGLSE